MKYYPILVNLQDQPVLVVGGGKVAERKIESLLAHGAAVRLAARTLTPGLKRYVDEGRVMHLGPEFEESQLDRIFLVVAATDDAAMNRKVSEHARLKGLLINAVDQPEDCNFIVPSVLRRGDLVIAVSTSGKSPAMAKKVREDLEESFGPEYGAFLNLMGNVRELILARGLSGEENKRIFQSLIHSSIPESLKKKDWEEAATILNGILETEYSAEEVREMTSVKTKRTSNYE